MYTRNGKQINETDPVVDRVARALTLLYVSDLRELQNDINDILVSAQAFTANPCVAAVGVWGWDVGVGWLWSGFLTFFSFPCFTKS